MAMASKPSLWKEAASLIIASKRSLPQNMMRNYEVLLLKRTSKAHFLPNLFVFPGGTVDVSDFANDWLSIIPPAQVKQTLQSTYQYLPRVGVASKPPIFARERDTSLPNEIALRITALRETFEEAGCLLIRKLDTDHLLSQDALMIEQKADMRERVRKDPGEFIHVCRDLGCYPDIGSLVEWCNWLTPVREKRRYDTIFYLACVPEPLIASHDNQETVESCWVTPAEAVQQHRQKKALLASPQLYDMLRLLRFPSFDYLQYFGRERSRTHPIQRWITIIVRCSDGFLLLLPGDRLHPTAQIAAAGDTNNWLDDGLLGRVMRNWSKRSFCEHASESRNVNCFAARVVDVNDDLRVADWIGDMTVHCNSISVEGHLRPLQDGQDPLQDCASIT